MLARVEKRLASEPVAFVGVHSPKFPNERDLAMVREAVRRYGVTHPVVVDSGHRIWSAYAVRAWPTLVFVDPFGGVIGQTSGEPDAQALEDVLLKLVGEYRARGVRLATEPLPLAPEPAPAGAFAHPGKVAVAGDRLFVADTGHHQVVELALEAGGRARELRRFGAGAPGLADGAAAEARFHHPNGLAVDAAGGALHVADTGNHALRRVDLASGAVATLAGTGEKGRAPLRSGTAAPAREAALRSPWDVALDSARGRLLVAMAGSHQLWALDLAAGTVSVVAGTGREERRDGAAAEAGFAQPSGVALAGARLYVADSEISCVREVDLDAGAVRTIAGGDLFDFGDRDGVGDAARLQHPMGVAAAGGRLLVADTFNHALKEVDAGEGRVTTLVGGGAAGPFRAALAADAGDLALPDRVGPGAPAFFEPEGVACDGAAAYVADTNNHRVVAVDLATGTARVVAGGPD